MIYLIQNNNRAVSGIVFLLLALASNVYANVMEAQLTYSTMLDASQSSYCAQKWRPVCAEPPIIFSEPVGSPDETGIIGGIFIPWSDQRLCYEGAGSLTKKDENWPGYMLGVPSGGLTGLYNKLTAALEFKLHGEVFEILSEPQAMRLWVDDTLVSHTPFNTGSTPGGITLTSVVFSDRKLRKIRIEFRDGFGGLIIQPDATFTTCSSQKKRRWMMVGDSFVEGSSSLSAGFTGMAQLLRAKFGVDMIQSGSGGTGYINSGFSGRYSYRGRVSDIAAVNPDVLLVFGSVNDGDNVSDFAAGLYFDSIKALRPDIKIIVVGPSWKTTPVYQGIRSRDGIATACSQRQIPFIDPIQEGREWFNAGNTATFYGGSTAEGIVNIIGAGIGEIVVTNPGEGYAFGHVPSITFSGGGGGAARAKMDYKLTAVSVLATGSGYSSAPLVNISGGNPLAPATAVAEIEAGCVTGIRITSSGSGFTSIPTISLVGGGGRGSVATAALSGEVSGVDILSEGVYTDAPAVLFSPPGDGTHPNQNGHDLFAEKIAWAIGEILSKPFELDAGEDGVSYTWSMGVDFIVNASNRILRIDQPSLANEGMYSVTITRSNGEVAVRNFYLTGSLDYDEFRYRYFPYAERYSLVSAPNSDSDADGLSNMLEYALGSNPNLSDNPQLKLLVSDGNLSLIYPTKPFAANVNLELQTSSDLLNWVKFSDSAMTSKEYSAGRLFFTHIISPPAGNIFFRLICN